MDAASNPHLIFWQGAAGLHGNTKEDTGPDRGPTLGLSARAAHSCSLTDEREQCMGCGRAGGRSSEARSGEERKRGENERCSLRRTRIADGPRGVGNTSTQSELRARFLYRHNELLTTK